MSVVIIGGNECMEREYKQLCHSYEYDAKIITKMRGSMKNKIGKPDLLVLFTSTMSHKMLRSALCEIKDSNAVIERSQTSSMAALKKILNKHSGRE